METPEELLFADEKVVWRLHGGLRPDRIVSVSAELAELQRLAREARGRAYAPYSRFSVGAAIRMESERYAGANVENASYGGTLCAERSAIVAAVSAGRRELELIAIASGGGAGEPMGQRSPCGLCRQVMGEFATEGLLVLLDGGDDAEGRLLGDVVPFEALLPWRFQLR